MLREVLALFEPETASHDLSQPFGTRRARCSGRSLTSEFGNGRPEGVAMQTDFSIQPPSDRTGAMDFGRVEKHGDDRDVISACVRGDRRAQETLYNQHGSHVYGLMFRLVGRDNAEDLTQQVFLKLFRSIGKFNGWSSFSTWLYRLAMNEALQFLRRERRRTLAPMGRDPVDECRGPSADLEDAEVLEWALSSLDPDIRTVFVLREVQRLSYHEIALALDIAEGTVASRLNRARRSLLQLLKPVLDG